VTSRPHDAQRTNARSQCRTRIRVFARSSSDREGGSPNLTGNELRQKAQNWPGVLTLRVYAPAVWTVAGTTSPSSCDTVNVTKAELAGLFADELALLQPTTGYMRTQQRSARPKTKVGGPDRDRTGDLLNAIQARSQLRYRPTREERPSIIADSLIAAARRGPTSGATVSIR
jgi:hypothetical protein